ncbi:MAG: CoA transferase, partial [Myxococcota bacterium]|nr:CoA transferase [Myxococcota bacterium]
MQEVLQDPQTQAAGGFVEVPDGVGTTLLPATPADFGGTPIEHRGMAPGHGEHTESILHELGRDDTAIATLRKSGVLGDS